MDGTTRRRTWAHATRWALRVLVAVLCSAVLLTAAHTPGAAAARADASRTEPAPPDGAGIPAPGARYAWPLLPVPAIGERFRAPPHPYGRGHRGVDLVGAAGQAVLAARDGTVVFAGPVGAKSVVSVDHDDGLRTTYEPVRPTVRAGAVVRAGDVLGLLDAGHPGCVAAACLHWGVRRGPREYLDPLVLVRPPEVRLLPVPDGDSGNARRLLSTSERSQVPARGSARG
jgi:murein DD-endopeptidase MepM/ murein hydrolase activator NlpD